MQKIRELIARFPLWIALVAGGLSAFGFAPWNVWPLTLLCFALLIHLIANAPDKRRAFLIGWLFGVGHFTIGNQWIAVAFTFQAAMPVWLGYIAVVALSLYLAIYPALATLGAWWITNKATRTRHSRESGSPSPAPDIQPNGQEMDSRFRGNDEFRKHSLPLILIFAGCWTITEWLRSWVFTGFAWNPLSVVALKLDAAPAMWLGTYGLSALIVIAAGMILLLVAQRWRAAIATTFALALVWGAAMFVQAGDSIGAAINGKRERRTALTIVQPNISQADKYAPGYDAINFHRLAKHSLPLRDSEPRLLLWPEAAIPDYLEDGYPYRYYQFQPGESAKGARARLTRLMGDSDVVITGANRLVIEDGQLVAARNSVSAMDATGKLLGHYDKSHLVPYGEYLPMPWLLRPLGLARLVPGELDFWPGPGPQTMTVNLGGKPVMVGMQICYEIIFSGQVADRKHRPDFIFNPSNDAWFGTIGPPQHLAQARLRAVEEGLPVVRATPTGISAVIDANGRILQSLPMGADGRIDAALPHARTPTLFARYGNILPVGFALLLIAAAFLPVMGRRRAA